MQYGFTSAGGELFQVSSALESRRRIQPAIAKSLVAREQMHLTGTPLKS